MPYNVPRMCIRPAKLKTTPCQGCEDRKVGCHGSCERYKAYDEAKREDYLQRIDAYYYKWDAAIYEAGVKRKIANRRDKKKHG